MLLVSAVALVVVVAAAVASILAVRSIPPPSYATDAPVAGSLVASAHELPGWRSGGRALFRPAQVIANPSLAPDAATLRADRGCAFLDGPTAPHQVTAVAADAFGDGTSARGSELFSEAMTYRTAAPVEADVAAAHRPGMAGCVARLLAESAGAEHVRSSARLKPVKLAGAFGDVDVLALEGTWTTFVAPTTGAPGAGVHIEVVLVTRSRAEVVIVVEAPGGPVPQGVVDRVALHAAQALQSQLA